MKTIVVVGGTKGIGQKLVSLLAGNNVYVIARSNAALGNDANTHFIPGDVTKSVDISAIPGTVDGLVYCPGTINLKPFARLSEADFMNDWQINFLGAVKIIQQLLPNLKKSAAASIVLFSTVAVSTGMTFHSSLAAAKGAIESFTRSMAAEFAPHIRVNCIAPSLTETALAEKLLNSPEKTEASAKRHPLQRIGQIQPAFVSIRYILHELLNQHSM